MEQMLESQQNAMVESYKKLGTVYSESSEKFEAPNTHDKKPDIQVQQTDKVTKRQKQKPRQIVDPFMSEGDEHHWSGELSGEDEAGTGDPILMLIKTFFPCRSALLKRTNISRCYLALDLNREITIEDFLEL